MKLREEKNLREISESLCTFLTALDEVVCWVDWKNIESKIKMQSSSSDDCIKILNLFDSELQLIKTKPVLKSKLKDMLGVLKKFKVQTTLVLEYKKIDDHKSMHKICYLSAKLIVNESDIDKSSG